VDEVDEEQEEHLRGSESGSPSSDEKSIESSRTSKSEKGKGRAIGRGARGVRRG
jgi:hypothetical protein